MARYIIEFLFCSGLFVALYKLLIKGRVAHHQARVYLVGALLLSVVIPALELPLYPANTVYYELPIIELTEIDIAILVYLFFKGIRRQLAIGRCSKREL